jgi:hypothetical protein
MARLQTFDGKIRTKDGECITGPDDACCCESPGCTECDISTQDEIELEVILSGVVGGEAICADMDGTYILPFDSGDTITCQWELEVPGLMTIIGVFHGPTKKWTVQLVRTTAPTFVTNYQLTIMPDKPPCDDTQYTLPFVGFESRCDWSEATCQVRLLIP